MEPIRDLSWMAQTASGETLERFELNGYSALALLVSAHGADRGGAFRYRILFFQAGERRPVYAVNLETSILGDWMLTEQEGDDHRVARRLPGPLDYEGFRVAALERAILRLQKNSLKNSDGDADTEK